MTVRKGMMAELAEQQARHEEAVAEVIVAAVKASRALYPDAGAEAIEVMAKLLMRRGASVLCPGSEGAS